MAHLRADSLIFRCRCSVTWSCSAEDHVKVLPPPDVLIQQFAFHKAKPAARRNAHPRFAVCLQTRGGLREEAGPPVCTRRYEYVASGHTRLMSDESNARKQNDRRSAETAGPCVWFVLWAFSVTSLRLRSGPRRLIIASSRHFRRRTWQHITSLPMCGVPLSEYQTSLDRLGAGTSMDHFCSRRTERPNCLLHLFSVGHRPPLSLAGTLKPLPATARDSRGTSPRSISTSFTRVLAATGEVEEPLISQF